MSETNDETTDLLGTSTQESEDKRAQKPIGILMLIGSIVSVTALAYVFYRYWNEYFPNERIAAFPNGRPMPKMAPDVKMPLLKDGSGLTESWDFDFVDRFCKGREKEGLPVFDDDDEDEDDENAFSDDSYEHDDGTKLPNQTSSRLRRRLKSAQVADDGIRRFKLASGATMPYYGSVDIQQEETSGAEFAIFVFHGAVRDASNYFCSGREVMVAQKKYPLEKSLLVVLKWHYEIDMPIPTDVWWNSSKPWGSWMAGGHSDEKSGAAISSFAVIDEFLVHLADNPKYPNLQEILLMGHSAGGQTLHRYAFATHLKPPEISTKEDVEKKLGFRNDIDVRFVIANPSSYLYLDTNRWAYSCGDEDIKRDGCTSMEYKPYKFSQARHGWTVDFEYGDEGYRVTEGLGQPGKDYPFICRSTSFNNWFYGLNWQHIEDGYVVPYIADHPDIKTALQYYPLRDVVYLVGQNDTCWDNEFPFCDDQCWTKSVSTSTCYRNHMDMRCPAMLQGPNRKQRALHYQRHLFEHYGRKVHNLFVIPNTGHQGGRMVTSDYGLTAIEGGLSLVASESVDPLSVPLTTTSTTTTSNFAVPVVPIAPADATTPAPGP
mmetsp:Transcript_57682/g.122723  ORF Transcript_57682/g.122723 Transcript_57682/m.122723 type:complete len:601 (+) Transcript_57682:81-1883(+)